MEQGASPVITVTALWGEPVRSAIFAASDPRDLAVRFTNDPSFRAETIGGRAVAVRDGEPVSGEPFGVPDTFGSLVVFDVGAFVMIQISTTNVGPDELAGVVASIDEDVVRAFDEGP